jgi:hypothetical protein
MKYLRKIFESESKLMDNYYKQANDIRAKFKIDIDVLGRQFIEDVNDCMHELTDRPEWVTKNESDGLFFRIYVFNVNKDDFKDFSIAVNDSLTKLKEHLGIHYTFHLIREGNKIPIKSLDEFNKNFYYYISIYYKNNNKPLTFELYLGENGK